MSLDRSFQNNSDVNKNMGSKLKWSNLEKPLSPSVLKVVSDVLRFEKMTPVQVS